MINVQTLLELVSSLGVGIGLAVVLWYALLTPRKHPDGTPRSSLLVPGWIVDAKDREMAALRTFYERIAAEREAEHDRRIQEWRGFRDEESVRRKEVERQREKLLEAINGLSAQLADALAAMAERDSDA